MSFKLTFGDQDKVRDATVHSPRAGDVEIDDPRAIEREDKNWRFAHAREAARLREGLLRLQILAGEQAARADAEGRWGDATLHREYRDLAKAIREHQDRTRQE